MKLFLVRHGQSEANLGHYYTGQMDVRLTDLGRQQAAEAGRKLRNIKFDKVFSSDLCRAWETCKIALPGCEPEKTPLLREYDVGIVQGRELGSIKLSIPDDPQRAPDYTPYGGEDASMVRARARSFLTSLEGKGYENVAAFAHYGFMNCVLREVFGTKIRNGSIKTDNCAIYVVENDADTWQLLAVNYMTEFE